MPIPTEYRDIVQMLASKTNEGNVNWQKGVYDISITINNSKFTIWAGTDEHTDEPFVAFALKDADGSAIDSWFVDESDFDYAEMLRLHKSAKRHALGVPNRLKELEKLISQMKTVGNSNDG